MLCQGCLQPASGLFLAATTTGGDAAAGDVYILTSIAAVVLGGISFYGGRGSALGSIAGAFVLTILTNVLFFAGINPLYQSFFQGLFLVLAVFLGVILGRLAEGKHMSEASRPSSGTRARDLLTVDRRRILVTFGAAILVFVVGAFLHPGFASADSVKAILVVASFVGLVAAGQTFVLLVGGIDLSVPWVLNAAGVLFATASLGRDSRAAYALLLALGLGAAVGLGQRSLHRVSRGPGRRDDPRDERDHGGPDARPYARAHVRDVPLIRPDRLAERDPRSTSPASRSS